MNHSERRELIELWLLAGEGAADAAQLAQLNSWIESDADARSYLLDVARQQGWLAWNAADLQLATAFGNMSPAADSVLATVAPRQPDRPPRAAGRRLDAGARRRWSWIAVAASVAGFVAGQWLTPHRQTVSDDPGQPAMFQATMVSSTGCIWGPGNTLDSPNHGLAGGDALQLLEGIAEFQIGLKAGDVRLQIEGPASIVLTAQGAASVSYGKIIIKTGELHDIYSIETPFGRVLADRQSEIGLICFGSTAEIHSFRGGATVESPWLSPSERDLSSVTIRANQALHFKDVGDGALEAAHGPAQRWRFTLQVPMTNDFLAVGADYVREILDARPVAYWRFEGDQDGVVRNEADDRFHGRLKGKIRWVGPVGNQAIEFGVTPEPGSLVVTDSWDEVLDGDFAMEAWIKPSHYHLGSIIGFIGEFDWKDRRNKHGVLLEVNGTSQPSNIKQPERIRFLYRPSLGVQGGVSSYSDQVYQPRQWQHVAAMRDGSQLRLYLNGELVQQAEATASLPPGLQLVMGQLYTETVERFFIGHVDEVAIYDRPLSEAEIGRRLQLLHRPKQVDGAVF